MHLHENDGNLFGARIFILVLRRAFDYDVEELEKMLVQRFAKPFLNKNNR